MSIIKSFSVGNGDMFYINHNQGSLSVIDCCMNDDNKEQITKEIRNITETKEKVRFISTHPDEDHILGLKYYNENIPIQNFYCVKNEASKDEETEDFKEYCKLRDNTHFYLYERKNIIGTGINVLWPNISNYYFKRALEDAKNGLPNNISPIIKYSLENGVKVLWFGDLEKEFIENIEDDLKIGEADIIFAPHHGRDSGKLPESLLKRINPKIIVIGEADSEDLNYYQGYNTITQNLAKDIIFECETGKVNVYVSNINYNVNFLKNEHIYNSKYGHYIGTLEL